MSTAPVITIFVRHSADCKYAGNEFSKRCSCRKHLRWTHSGSQYRRTAGTSSWADAEKVKREIEGQLSGRPAPAPVVLHLLSYWTTSVTVAVGAGETAGSPVPVMVNV